MKIGNVVTWVAFRVLSVCPELWDRVWMPRTITWRRYVRAVNKLANMLEEDPDKAFNPGLIVAISRGGAVAGDLLSRKMSNLPFVTLWADRRYPPTREVSYDKFNTVDIRRIVSDNDIKSILLVDDFCKRGDSLKGALDFIKSQLKELPKGERKSVQVKTAVLAKEKRYDGDRRVNPDYCILEDKEWLPYGRG